VHDAPQSTENINGRTLLQRRESSPHEGAKKNTTNTESENSARIELRKPMAGGKTRGLAPMKSCSVELLADKQGPPLEFPREIGEWEGSLWWGNAPCCLSGTWLHPIDEHGALALRKCLRGDQSSLSQGRRGVRLGGWPAPSAISHTACRGAEPSPRRN